MSGLPHERAVKTIVRAVVLRADVADVNGVVIPSSELKRLAAEDRTGRLTWDEKEKHLVFVGEMEVQ